MNDANIKCPNCGTAIDVDELLNHQAEEKYKKAFEEKASTFLQEINKQKEIFAKEKKDFDEKKSKENELFQKRLDQKLEEEKQKITKEQAQKIKEEYELNVKKLEEENQIRKKENDILKEKELAFLKREEDLKEKEKDLELQLQRKLQEEREALEEKIKKQEQDKTELRFKEYEKKIEQTQKALEEAQRKATQGSMQLQGEVQELALENLLKESFPFDIIEEVGKGVRGADCIQVVRNNFGQVCGKIIYESKRTQAFSNEWIEKLKTDMRAKTADIAVIVTQTMPKDMEQFGERSGIWICTIHEVRALAHVLRNSILKIYAVSKSQENKGDKMSLLYDYLTSNEFNEQWKAIREGFLAMRHSIDSERTLMEKLWKAREKQLDKILKNSSHISGSVEGIAGTENIDIKLIDEADI
ncbi:MAG TPA: DUF2130 domain-containing protein [Chitinophagales bacterium]|nr:DUF2130 domain-containing protein [Chitinophagales bacterium]